LGNNFSRLLFHALNPWVTGLSHNPENLPVLAAVAIPAIVPKKVSAKVVAASEVPLITPAPILSYQGYCSALK